MTSKVLQKNLYFIIIAGVILIFARYNAFGEMKFPGDSKIQREEFELRQKLKPILADTLKGQFVDLGVTVLYLNQKKPILGRDSIVKRFKLPGFESHINIANSPDDIQGYVEKFDRYRTFILLVNSPLGASIENSLQQMLKEKAKLELGVSDTFNILVVDADSSDLSLDDKNKKKKQKEMDSLLKEMGEDQKAKWDRLSKLFPGLDRPPDQIDPRLEAESSKHLISSRQAFYKNDLNTALNEVIEAINVNPYSPKSYEMLGSIYYRLKWKNLALSNWVKALALDPENKKLGKYISLVKNQL